MTTAYAQVDAAFVTMDWLNSLDELKAKLTSTSHGRSRTAIYMAMPPSIVLPLLAFSQVTGAVIGDDFTVQQARMSFDVFASSRFQASDIKDTLVSAIETVGPTGGFTSAKGRIGNARTVNISFRLEPGREPDASIFRFIVDGYFWVTP